MLSRTLTPVTNDCFTIGAMNLGSRIKTALEICGMTPPEVERASGGVVQAAALHQLFRRDSERSRLIEPILAVLPANKVNADWVRSGVGRPTPETKLTAVESGREHSERQEGASPEQFDNSVEGSPLRSWEHPTELPPGNRVFIPRLRMQTVGEGAEQKVVTVLAKSEVQSFDADWIRDDQLKPIGLAYSIAADASMAPVIFKGDKFVVDTNQKDVIDGTTFVIHYGEGERARKLFRLPGGGLRIEANNKDYPSLDLSAEQAKAVIMVGRVVQRMGRGGL